jgi:sec-independent protein translocase protein TatB
VFNLQGSELVIILLLALVVLGPEKLPDAMRKAGQFYAELKKMSSGFQKEFRDAADEPMREMRDTATLLRDSADFRKLQDGDRAEKPRSAEMLAAADPDAQPTDDIPTFEADVPAGPSEVDGTGADTGDDTGDTGDTGDALASAEPTPGDPDRTTVVREATPTPPPPPPFSSSKPDAVRATDSGHDTSTRATKDSTTESTTESTTDSTTDEGFDGTDDSSAQPVEGSTE